MKIPALPSIASKPVKGWSIYPIAVLYGLLLMLPPITEACPLVIRAGAKQNLQAMMGGYCRINGSQRTATPLTGPEVRRRAFVTNSDGDSVSIIDRISYKVLNTLKVGDYPHHMIISMDGRHLYVGNTHSDTVSVLDLATEKIVKTLPILDPYNLYYTPDHKSLVTTCTRFGRVEVHAAEEWNGLEKANGWTRLAQIPTGKDPNHFAFSPDGRFMYTSNEYSHQLSVIDLQARKLVRQVDTGKRPVDVSLAPGGKALFVANYGEGRVTVYETDSFKELDRIQTGAGAHGMAMSVDGKTLFVSNRDASSVSVVDVASRKVTQTLKIPQGPDMLEVTPDGRELWVTGRYGANVFVVDLATGKITQRIRTGASPHGIVLIDLAISK
ncbi:MAG: beta-propeller fold lactonase family protein [Deltaproteobacteria bacterium]|nr:beta-propeller fold lactonase family protein [Deltaproteobacteria bacterium]